MEHLNFKKNFNNKLFGNYLTTFRSTESIDKKDLYIGDEVELQLNHIPLATATVVEIDKFNITEYFDETPKHLRMLLSMDVGTSFVQAYDSIRFMCGNEVTLLLLNVNKRL